jgi:hypothetical protein
MRKHQYVILTLALISAPVCQAFNPGTFELGVEISGEYSGAGNQGIYTFNLPDQIRAGVFVFENASIVARLASAVVSSGSGQQSVNSYSFGAGYYISKDYQRSWAVIEVMGLADFATGFQEGSQFGFGLGFGIQRKYQVIFPRLEFVFEQWFESEYNSRTTFKLLLGFSFYSAQ